MTGKARRQMLVLICVCVSTMTLSGCGGDAAATVSSTPSSEAVQAEESGESDVFTSEPYFIGADTVASDAKVSDIDIDGPDDEIKQEIIGSFVPNHERGDEATAASAKRSTAVNDKIESETISDKDKKEAASKEAEKNKAEVDSKKEEFASLDAIKRLVGTKADCQTTNEIVFTNGAGMGCPYDVTWNYGDLYDEYVAACDWSLVFDADYYKKEFPMLAMQYNYDDEWLLKQFQTQGVHEGRQGCADFNVGAYLYNCDDNVYDTFGNDDLSVYYIYYMLNHDTEKNINTTTSDEGEIKKYYRYVLTKNQILEFNDINDSRLEHDATPVDIDPELVAIANYRAIINVQGGYHGHTWLDEPGNEEKLLEWGTHTSVKDKQTYSENTVTFYKLGTISRFTDIQNSGRSCFADYQVSPPHYAAINNPKNQIVGISHIYFDKEVNHQASQFEMFRG